MASDSDSKSPEEGSKKAEQCLEAAQKNIEIEEFETAVNRAYYAVFHSARACVWLRDIYPKSHRGVQQKFHEIYVKNEQKIDPKTAATFGQLEDIRLRSDYGTLKSVTEVEAKEVLEKAKDFLDETKTILDIF
jgi:uncharacterized protein (UPF0332 family)